MRPEDIIRHFSKRTVYDWGVMSWHMDDSLQEGAGISLASMMVLPGKTSTAHRHNNVNEIIHVTNGSVEQRVGDLWVKATEGCTVFVPKGEIHQSRNLTSRPVSMMIAYSGGARNYEEVDA